MSRRNGPILRLLLAIVDAGWWLAPPSRRRDWRRQWRADILHEWQWRARHPRGVGDRAGLFVRAAGGLRHAFWLRLHVRRLEMLTQDIRYGWRLMVRKPAFTLVAVLMLGALLARAEEFKPEPGFISLFNGQDLTGWRYLPQACA